MGITRTDIYTVKQNHIAQFLKVLGHPARIAIIEHIIQQNACICNDLVEELGLAQATISQHLKELKSIGIIKGTIEGKSMCYCINEKVWKKIQRDLFNFFNKDIPNQNCC